MKYVAALAGTVARFQPSDSLKTTAIGLDLSQLAVSCETVNMRMSTDMCGPLSDKPDGTTTYTHVTNACLPAGKRSNKTPFSFQDFVTPAPS